VRQGLVFEVGDDLLDDGVAAVFGLDELKFVGAVGDEREVPPIGEQLRLFADQAGAPDDQPPAAVDGFGDLRLAAGRVLRLSGLLCVRPRRLVGVVSQGVGLRSGS